MKNILLFMSDIELDLKGYFDFEVPKLDCQRLKENYLLKFGQSVSQKCLNKVLTQVSDLL